MAYPQDCHLCSKAVESWDDGVVCSKCWHNPSLTKLFKGEDCCTKCNALMPAVRHFSAPPNQANQFAEIENSRAALLSKETFSDVNRLDEMAQTRWCRQCEAMPFAFARTCGAYSGTLAANILFLKSQPHICRRLREIIRQTFTAQAKFLASDFVLPVPLHSKRKIERGFNQAELLAKVLAADFNLRFAADALVRVKNTDRHRAGMDALDRLKSIERAFQLTNKSLIKNASVLLVDDVFTTGSTICEAAKTLLDAGAAHVQVFTIAKVTDVSDDV
jgi:ComF family protein